MAKINVLPKHIADLIAAGEVVERPSSVIKELMENAIDAGATSLTVEIKNGGVTYMRVTDNGSGILRDDIRNAFVSHATSKILTEEDLHGIGTLGFRGEALASIAAVSRVDVLTRTADDDVGTVYKIEGSEEVLLSDAGCPEGTTIVVKDLFYNTPARMKFLKKDVTEGNSVAGVVDRIALSHPEISIRFIRDDKQILVTPGNGNLKSTIYSVFGKDFSNALLETSYELNGVSVNGFVSKPTASRPNRSMQFFFLNGRLVKSMTASAALERAYKDAIMVGKFPACVLNIDLPFEMVDVNVHPAKTEVRFSNERPVFDAVYYAAKNAITVKDTPNRLTLAQQEVQRQGNFKPETGDQLKLDRKKLGRTELPEKIEGFWSKELPKEWERKGSGSSKKKSVAKARPDEPVNEVPAPTPLTASDRPVEETTKTPEVEAAVEELKQEAFAEPKKAPEAVEPKAPEGPVPYVRKADRPKEEPKAEPPKKAEQELPVVEDVPVVPFSEETELPDFRIIGEAFKTYILVELEGKMLMVDKHAAHERILYDRLIANKEPVQSQMLLMPVTVSLSKEEYSAVLEHTDLLQEAGFDVSAFGPGLVAVREVPVMLIKEDVTQILSEIAGRLLDRNDPTPEKLDWMYKNMACRAAVKAGDDTPPAEQEKFIEYILSHREVRYCPHGRPILIEMTRPELEKTFGRIQLKTGPSVRQTVRRKKKD
ncbi:MAG: DNA mismatch repair endonuclease MutL [Clostridia bacterium]|nr:DNA mismatch repair endonuclease MutL [Clostridia bacterium]